MLVRVGAVMARAFARGAGIALGRSNGVLGRLLRGYSFRLAHPMDVAFDAMGRAGFGGFLLARRAALVLRELLVRGRLMRCRLTHCGLV